MSCIFVFAMSLDHFIDFFFAMSLDHVDSFGRAG